MVAEDDRGLVPVLRELGPEPRELVGGERSGIATRSGLVVGVDPDDAQVVQLAREVAGFVAREELVLEAVVALPLSRAAGGPWIPRVRAVMVAARDEVVAL